jgi:hypothetical protein
MAAGSQISQRLESVEKRLTTGCGFVSFENPILIVPYAASFEIYFFD